MGDHPRGCGGTTPCHLEVTAEQGPSPRVRGNPREKRLQLRHGGTIPAGAGEPAVKYEVPVNIVGPSPRVRGNPSATSLSLICKRTIPAGAGEPRRHRCPSIAAGDHPRGCGGTGGGGGTQGQGHGPSPRVRGNRCRQGQRLRGQGTIPAGAGEPSSAWPPRRAPRDHPRGCGGTCVEVTMAIEEEGPSPRVRGNPSAAMTASAPRGTIPAGAGEPVGPGCARRRVRDHPRGCGGTDAVACARAAEQGPSPRVRGNPRDAGACLHDGGTIPAGAGEPPAASDSPSGGTDHPRGCGGTVAAVFGGRADRGPSPRVRGNRAQAAGIAALTGTIPAGAGEPRTRRGR